MSSSRTTIICSVGFIIVWCDIYGNIQYCQHLSFQYCSLLYSLGIEVNTGLLRDPGSGSWVLLMGARIQQEQISDFYHGYLKVRYVKGDSGTSGSILVTKP